MIAARIRETHLPRSCNRAWGHLPITAQQTSIRYGANKHLRVGVDEDYEVPGRGAFDGVEGEP